MRRRRNPRISRSDLDRLLAGGSPGPEDRGLTALFDAVTAPASPQELSGERAAVAGFVSARRNAHPAAASSGRRRTPLLARAATVKVMIAAAVLVLGGTAVAAETGSLPDAAQHHAHRLFSRLGVPPPETLAPTPAPSTSAGTPSDRPSPSTGSSSALGRPEPSASAPITPEARSLCRTWQAAGDKKNGKPMPPGQLRRLTDLAGGDEARIPAFCSPVAPDPTATPAPGDSVSPSPTGTAKKPAPSEGPSKDKGPKKSKEPAPPGRK
jgi:hypothetical protein